MTFIESQVLKTRIHADKAINIAIRLVRNDLSGCIFIVSAFIVLSVCLPNVSFSILQSETLWRVDASPPFGKSQRGRNMFTVNREKLSHSSRKSGKTIDSFSDRYYACGKKTLAVESNY